MTIYAISIRNTSQFHWHHSSSFVLSNDYLARPLFKIQSLFQNKDLINTKRHTILALWLRMEPRIVFYCREKQRTYGPNFRICNHSVRRPICNSASLISDGQIRSMDKGKPSIWPKIRICIIRTYGTDTENGHFWRQKRPFFEYLPQMHQWKILLVEDLDRMQIRG